MNKLTAGIASVTRSPLGFVRGLRYPLRGARFVYREHPGLVRYWIFPILITTAALAGVSYLAFHYYDDLSAALWSLFPASWGEATGWVSKLVAAVRGLLSFLVAIALLLVGLVTVVVLSTVVAAPFNDSLSEAVERIVTGGEAPAFSLRRLLADLGRALRIELFKVVLYLAIVGPLFVGSFFLPVLGQLMSVVGFVFTALYFGIDYVDWPAARRDWSVSDRVSLVQRQFAAISGFGTGVWLLLFVPLLNLFFMPAAVAGGTLLFLDLAEPPAGEV